MPTEVFFSGKMSICGSLPVTCGDVGGGGGVAPDFAGDVIFGPSLTLLPSLVFCKTYARLQ